MYIFFRRYKILYLNQLHAICTIDSRYVQYNFSLDATFS